MLKIKERHEGEKGTTLLELIICMTIFMIIMTAVCNVFDSLSSTDRAQEQLVRAEQMARQAMAEIVNDLRVAGYNPTGAAFTRVSGTSSSTNASLTMNTDTNGNGTISSDEQITYSWNAGNSTMTRQSGGKTKTYGNVVQSLALTFYDVNRVVTATPANIREVKVDLVVRTTKRDPKYGQNGGFRTVALSNTVFLRN